MGAVDASIHMSSLRVPYNLRSLPLPSPLLSLPSLLSPPLSSPPLPPGHEAYNQEQWWYVREWMLEALRKTDEEQSMDEVELTSIYDHLAYAEYQVSGVRHAHTHTQTDRHVDRLCCSSSTAQLGNVKKAMQYTRDLLQNGEVTTPSPHTHPTLHHHITLPCPAPLDRARP